MKKLRKIEKWFAVELSSLVLCGEIYTKYGPKVVYTGTLWGLKNDYAVCYRGIDYNGEYILDIIKLGKVDSAWIKTEDAHCLDEYELRGED